jgi:hypothetical protein
MKSTTQLQRPMVNCVSEYTNDFISNDKQGLGYSTGTNMYEAMLEEGHDARLLRFSPSNDDTIKGGHQDPRNLDYWQVGCMGITVSCSSVRFFFFWVVSSLELFPPFDSFRGNSSIYKATIQFIKQ